MLNMYLMTEASSRREERPVSVFARRRELLPGLALTGGLAFVAIEIARLGQVQSTGLGALTPAIVLGIVVGNTGYSRIAAASAVGVAFSKQTLLRFAIVLYGLRLTFQDIGHVGLAGVAVDATMLCTTFGLACLLGVRVFGLDRKTAILIGAGSSICGAAAVMATEPVVRARAEEAAIAISTVVVFGTLGMFLYPLLFRLNAQHHWIALSAEQFGVFAGSTIHEVAQVLAAGRAVGDEAANAAVVAKLVRVMMLAPFLIALSAYLSRSTGGATTRPSRDDHGSTIAIPWFAFGFLAIALLNSCVRLPSALVSAANAFDTVLLAAAMAALGLTTQVSALRTAGMKPLLLAALLFSWLLVGGLAVNAGLGALLR